MGLAGAWWGPWGSEGPCGSGCVCGSDWVGCTGRGEARGSRELCACAGYQNSNVNVNVNVTALPRAGNAEISTFQLSHSNLIQSATRTVLHTEDDAPRNGRPRITLRRQ